MSLQAALHALVEGVGLNESSAGCDLMLVAGDGLSGLVLTYRHRTDADEYERRSWGEFAMTLDG